MTIIFIDITNLIYVMSKSTWRLLDNDKYICMLITKNLNSEANIAHSFDVNQNYLTTSDGEANTFFNNNYRIIKRSSVVIVTLT